MTTGERMLLIAIGEAIGVLIVEKSVEYGRADGLTAKDAEKICDSISKRLALALIMVDTEKSS